LVEPALSVDQIPLPGALISIVEPKLLKLDLAPVLVVEATVMTPLQLAGEKLAASAELFPAATTTMAPAAMTALIAL